MNTEQIRSVTIDNRYILFIQRNNKANLKQLNSTENHRGKAKRMPDTLVSQPHFYSATQKFRQCTSLLDSTHSVSNP